MRFISIFILAAILGAPVADGWAQTLDWRDDPAAAAVFAESGFRGTFVLYDVGKDEFSGYDRRRAETRYVPASTFKIPNSLIGLEYGAVKDVDEPLPWDGQAKWIKRWEKDMGLREAIKVSNVPAYQELARRVGLDKMRRAVAELDYGNKDIGRTVDAFWLEGPLEISAVEQVRLLARLAQGELPFAPEIQAAVRDIVKAEEAADGALYAKTGTAAVYTPQLGWLVGWVERSGRIYAFALNIDMPSPEDGPKRVELSRASLKALGIL